jgi:hypothetical protein
MSSHSLINLPAAYMKTANAIPNPTIVTSPPPCAINLSAPPVLNAVPALFVALLFPFPLPVAFALPLEVALPDVFVLLVEDPVAPEPLADLVFVAVAVALDAEPEPDPEPASPVVLGALLLVVDDWIC